MIFKLTEQNNACKHCPESPRTQSNSPVCSYFCIKYVTPGRPNPVPTHCPGSSEVQLYKHLKSKNAAQPNASILVFLDKDVSSIST